MWKEKETVSLARPNEIINLQVSNTSAHPTEENARRVEISSRGYLIPVASNISILSKYFSLRHIISNKMLL